MADQPPATASDAALSAAEAGLAVAEPADLGYAVSLEAFSGPLDLLLYLVRKTELDIADIPVSVIADQFVATVRGWQERDELDLEIAGDFILMAATLIEIKARALAPPPAEEETNHDGSADDDDFADPRADLIRKLLAYRKYKEAAQLLVGCETARAERVYRRFKEEIPEDPEEAEAIDLGELDPGGLAKHWFTIVARLGGLGPRTVSRDDIPIESRITSVLARAEEVRNLTLTELFERETSLQGRVTTLMAILEVVRQRYLESRQIEQYAGVDLRWREAEERTRPAELPPAELEEPKRRRRRPPLVTWVPATAVPSESGSDAQSDTDSDGDAPPEPFESDEERFLRELNEACNLDQVLVRAKDWESGFAAHWNELHPPPPPELLPEPLPVAEPPPVASEAAASVCEPVSEPVPETVAEVIVAPAEAIVTPEAGADASAPSPKPIKPKWVPPWVLAKQAKDNAAREHVEQLAREQAALEQAALEQAALEQAALEQAAHAPVSAGLTPDAEPAEATSLPPGAPQTDEALHSAPSALSALSALSATDSETVAETAPTASLESPASDASPIEAAGSSADVSPATACPHPPAEPVREQTAPALPDEPAQIDTVASALQEPTSLDLATGGDELSVPAQPVDELPSVVSAAVVEPVDSSESEVVVAARALSLAQPAAIAELDEVARTSPCLSESTTEPATIDLPDADPEPTTSLDVEEVSPPTSPASVTGQEIEDAKVSALPVPELIVTPAAPLLIEAANPADAVPPDEPAAATHAAAAFPTVFDVPSEDDDHDNAAETVHPVTAEVVTCIQAIAAEPPLECAPAPMPDPACAPDVATATAATPTASPWPLALALGLSGLLIGGLFISKQVLKPTAAISRIAPVSPTPVLVVTEPTVIIDPLPLAVPLPTLWELWTTVAPTRWLALTSPAVVPWTAWLPTPPPWPALDDLSTPINLTTLPIAALGIPGGGIFARSAALPRCQVVPWDAYLPRPPVAPLLVEWIAATSRRDVPLAAWAQPHAWTLMISLPPQPLPLPLP